MMSDLFKKDRHSSSSGSEAAAVISSGQQSLLDKCMETVRKYHLPYRVLNETPAFGDCFFEAIYDQIQQNESIYATVSESARNCRSHLELRQGLINYIRQNSSTLHQDDTFLASKVVYINDEEYMKSLNMQHQNEEERWETCLRNMSQPTVWVKDIFIALMPRFLQKDICIAATDYVDEEQKRYWGPFSCKMEQIQGDPITLAAHCNLHFQSIHPNQQNGPLYTCRGCGTPNLSDVSQHTNENPNCKKLYGMNGLVDISVAERRDYLAENKEARLKQQAEKDEAKREATLKQQAKRDEAKREAKRQQDRERYAANREAILKEQAERDEANREAKRKQDKERYEANREAKQQQERERYAANREARLKQQAERNEANREAKRKQEAERKEAKKEAKRQRERARYAANRDARLKQQAERDEANREANRKKQLQRDEANREAKRKQQLLRDEANREAKRKQQLQRDEQNREAKRQKQLKKDEKRRAAKRKRQAELDKRNQEAKRKKQAELNAQNRECNRKQAAEKRAAQRHTFDEDQRLNSFSKSIQDGLSFTCNVCHGLWYRESVVKIQRDRQSDTQLYICKTCQSYVKRKKLSPMSAENGLIVETIPECLQLNELEVMLIAKSLIFLKMFPLPVRRWSAVKDKVVLVPIESDTILKTLDEIQSYPRQPSGGGLIPVVLSRKKEYKNYVLNQYIDPKKLILALKMLQEMENEWYQDIHIDEHYVPSIDDFGLDINYGGNSSTSTSTSDSNSDSSKDTSDDDDDHILNTVRDNQHRLPDITMFANDHPETDIRTRGKVNGVKVAPGQGIVPGNLMRDKNWDVKSHPNNFPSGKYGLNHDRPIKISPQKVIIQKIRNKSPIFRDNKSYVFASMYYLEKYQFERNISISAQRGNIVGGQLQDLQDPLAVFDKLKGTARYWQTKRFELVAKLEQLGPFHVFFTLSCADKRWPETFVSILAQRGHDITFKKHESNSGSQAYIDGVKLEDYLENENMSDMIRNNVYILTRVFDKRVHMFLKHIINGQNTPFPVKYWHYRVEFQKSGAAHIHGVLWFDTKALEIKFPGISKILNNLASKATLDEQEVDILCSYIDSIVSCSLQNPDIKDTVESVQIHNHTKTCRKYGTECRFGYGRLPSKRTLIAQPLVKAEDETEKEYQKKIDDATTVLTKVKDIVNNLPGSFEDIAKVTIADILDKAGVDEDSYYNALSISVRGTIVVLKRTPQEIWVNNYNPEWIKAWNANMDISVCLDFYAIITYITDYYTKDESGTLKPILEQLKACRSTSIKETMRSLANTFLTHRQVSEMEAYYRIFPDLHLCESNVATVFVAGGFPENRRVFFKKVNQGETNRNTKEDCDSTSNCSDQDFEPMCKPKGPQYKKAPTPHDKYKARPDHLEHLCLAQFTIMYKTVPKQAIKKTTFHNKVSTDLTDFEIICPHEHPCNNLPHVIQLSVPELGFMRCRSFPAVFREHKFKEQKDPHQYYYNELLMYRHWRCEEDEFSTTDITQCLDVLNTPSTNNPQLTVTEYVQQNLFPNKNYVRQARSNIDEEQDTRPSNIICDLLDPQAAQINDDLQHVEEVLDQDHVLRTYDGDINEGSGASSIFRTGDLSNLDTDLASTRQLAGEQQIVLNRVIGYCKELRQAKENGSRKPKAPLLIIHGGSGCGKSKLIKDISIFVEHILTTNDNRDANKPFVIRCAPTGSAAKIINGHTLHSAFQFNFGNDHMPMGEKNREKYKDILENLTVLIIDEMSMVKSDMLYQLHMRLRELKQNNELEFGGVCVLLFGDLMQLQPVKGAWIFNPPNSNKLKLVYTVHSLWHQFEPYILKENHRQNEDRVYGDIINRIRFEQQTDEDIEILNTRVIPDFPSSVPPNALHIYAKRHLVQAYNDQRLGEIATKTYTIDALHIHPNKQNYRPKIQNDGTINDTPFKDQLQLKVGARVMLTFNIDTIDGLTNGSTGTIHDILEENGKVSNIMVIFDDAQAGEQTRKKHQTLLKKYPGLPVTPISKIEFDYSLGKSTKNHTSKAKVVQIPLTLAWAITAHKVQGLTVRNPQPVAIDLNSVFGPNQAYVMLGRAQVLSQLYLKPFEKEKIWCSDVSLNESSRLLQKAEERESQNLWLNETFANISCMNIRSLQKHFLDLGADFILSKSDIIGICESFYPFDFQPPPLPNFNGVYVNRGRGRGVAVFIKDNIHCETFVKVSKSHHQIIKAVFGNFDYILVYKSPKSTTTLEFFEDLESLIDLTKPTIICGDFNMATNVNTHNFEILTEMLTIAGFHQIVNQPTHIKGNMLDHMYVRGLLIKHHDLHHPHYTDHDAICAVVKEEI